MRVSMIDGYAFELAEDHEGSVLRCSDEYWDIVVYTPDGREDFIGHRVIDGVICEVFICSDAIVRAQMSHMCRFDSEERQ